MSLQNIWKMWFLLQTRTFVQGYGCSSPLQYGSAVASAAGASLVWRVNTKKERSRYWRVHKRDSWWQDVDFSTGPHLFFCQLWWPVSHSLHSCLCIRGRCWEKECVQVQKKETEKQREVVGDKGGFQRGQAHFEAGVWDLTEVRFAFHGGRPHSIRTSKMLFRQSSEQRPPPPRCRQYINLSQPSQQALQLWNIFIL